jgi:hypothetical protein
LGTIHQVRLQRGANGDGLDSKSLELLRFCALDGSYFLPDAELREARQRGLALSIVRSLSAADVPVEFVLPHDGAVCNQPPEDARLAVLARLLSEERAGGDLHIRFLGRNRTVPFDGFQLDRAGGQRRYVWQVIPATESRASAALIDRFPGLQALFSDPDTRVALSLGSGGLKLFAHATALRFLEAIACAEHIDELWGSSGGAIAGLLYSFGLSPQAIEQSGYDLYSGRYNLALRPSKLRVLQHLLRETLFSEPGEAGFHDGGAPLAEMFEHYCASFRPPPSPSTSPSAARRCSRPRRCRSISPAGSCRPTRAMRSSPRRRYPCCSSHRRSVRAIARRRTSMDRPPRTSHSTPW